MEIALLGGTGDIGEGLALRFARDSDHSVVVGSRDSDKAERRADDYYSALKAEGVTPDVAGYSNETAAELADAVVVSVPPEYATSTVEAVAPELDEGDVLVSPAVRMDRDSSGFHYDPPATGTVAEAIEAAAPDGVPVVGAFQNLAAGALSDLDKDLSADVVVTGDDDEAKRTVSRLAEDVDGLRAIDGGPIANSDVVESVTPLLINLAMNNDGMHDLGVRFQ